MCGRYAINKETDEMIVEFVAQGGRPQDWRPVYSVAPTEPAPIVRNRQEEDATERQIVLANWGFQPSWYKPKGVAPINARLETIATNGMFKGAFARHRCLVPMTGYYEWQAQEDGKQPYFLHSAERTLAAAGLYSARKVDDEWKLTYTVITRTAKDAAGEVHDRMPVFLSPDFRDSWLNVDTDTSETLRLLEYSSTEVAQTISSYAVSRRVNSVRAVDPTDPTLVDQIELPFTE